MKARVVALPPGLDRTFFEDVLPAMEEQGYSQVKLAPIVPGLAARLAPLCDAIDRDGGSPAFDELESWVRWRRLPAYWLTYVVQIALARRASPFFVLACSLYADAQISMNDGLAMVSLENGYVAAEQLGAGVVPALVTASLKARLRSIYAAYRHAYTTDEVNPLFAHSYSQRTWAELAARFDLTSPPEVGRGGLERAVDACAADRDVRHRVIARRFLAAAAQEHDPAAAEEALRLALAEAIGADLDTEIGHLHRLHGQTLTLLGRHAAAEASFERAVAHEGHPLCAYWHALSARELGDARMRMAGPLIDRHDPPPLLGAALAAYRAGRASFERHVPSGPIPVARAIEQEMFRTYADNALQAAMLSSGSEAVAEVEALGPRYATDVVAEGRAAAEMDPGSAAAYRDARAVFSEDLTLFAQGTDLDAGFEAYLAGVKASRSARQTYLRTRNALMPAIQAAQRSDGSAAALRSLGLARTAFLMFHVGARQTMALLVDGETAEVRCGAACQLDPEEWRREHDRYRALIGEARGASGPTRIDAGKKALDGLLSWYEATFGGFLRLNWAFLEGRRLKIIPRRWMNEAALHAMTIDGTALAGHCEVSYAATLDLFLQLRRPGTRVATGAPLVVHDDARALAYEGTLRFVQAGDPDVRVLKGASWDDVAAALKSDPPSDLVFACHGRYDEDDPRRSVLELRADAPVTFSRLFADLDLAGCRSVTMGACESGLGRTVLSAESFGLPLAFLAAGVRYVVGTLWEVNALAAAILIGHHIVHVQAHGGVVRALTEAQRALMRMPLEAVIAWVRMHLPRKAAALERQLVSMGPRPFEHPYFWAGFFVSGDI